MQITLSGKHAFYTAVASLLLAYNPASLASSSDEFAVFKFTEIEGNFAAQRRSAEQLTGQTGDAKTKYAITLQEEEFNILTHSYVYHPNLLTMELGTGLYYSQSEQENPNVANIEVDERGYNLNARLNFLKKKPYPFTVYYDLSNPSISTSRTEQYVQSVEKYGVNASIRESVLPFTTELDVFRQTQKGQGAVQTINTSTEQFQLRTYYNLGKKGFGQFDYTNKQYTSENGEVNSTINKQETFSESISLNTMLKLGEKRQFDFNNLITYITQDNLPDRQDLMWMPGLSWTHSAATSSFYQFNFMDSEIEQIETKTRSGRVSILSSLTKSISATGDIHSESIETVGLSNKVEGFGGNLKYSKPLSFGLLSLNAGARYDETGRETTQNKITRVAESVRLDGTQRVALSESHVLLVSKVIHESLARQYITLVPGLDYEIELPAGGVGQAYIRRLGTANLASGESVLVDYEYQTGGNVEYSSLNRNYRAHLKLFDYYSVYYTYSDTGKKSKKGFSTIPLYSLRFQELGFRVDHPFLLDTLRLGGEVVRSEQDDGISSYVSRNYEAFMQMRVFSDARLNLTGSRYLQDYEFLNENVDVRRQSVKLTMQPLQRASLILEIKNEKDVGGSVVRRIKTKLVTGLWRIRQLTLSVNGSSIFETQGANERENNTLMFRLNREF